MNQSTTAEKALLENMPTLDGHAPVQSTPGSLQSRNVRIHKRRTSVRLEPAMWNALNEIATLERCSIHDLCGAVADLKEPGTSFTAALRVFLMEYYRSAAKTSPNIVQIQRHIKGQHEEPQSQT